MIKMSYSLGLLGYECVQMGGDLEGFDKTLSRYPDFYQLVECMAYGPNHFQFKYVKAWRRYGKNWYWKLRILLSNGLLRIANYLFAIKHSALSND